MGVMGIEGGRCGEELRRGRGGGRNRVKGDGDKSAERVETRGERDEVEEGRREGREEETAGHHLFFT